MRIEALCLLALARCAAPGINPDGPWLDLTHSFSSETIYWPTADGFTLTIDSKSETEKGYWYEANSFCTAEHGGTHLDAPAHFARGAQAADEIPIERLIGPAFVIDVTQAASADSDYQVRVADIQAFEAEHGQLPPGAIVLLRTGFGKHWPNAEKYLGTSERGPDAVAQLHFPGLHPDAARWLVEERSIDAIGLDTASIDYGQSQLYETHCILFAENIPAFENVANLEALPAVGAMVIALPMKIEGGSGGPLRIVAALPAARPAR